MNVLFLFLGVFFGWQFYGLWLDITANTDDLKVMRCGNPKRVKKYNEDQKVIDDAIIRQLKIVEAIKQEGNVIRRIKYLERKLK